jgi:hypothetical protein
MGFLLGHYQALMTLLFYHHHYHQTLLAFLFVHHQTLMTLLFGYNQTLMTLLFGYNQTLMTLLFGYNQTFLFRHHQTTTTPICYQPYLQPQSNTKGSGAHILFPPTLDTQTLTQIPDKGPDEGQGFIFNLGEGNVQPVMSEKERIRKLEEEIKEVQVIKTIMLNELEVRTRRWT